MNPRALRFFESPNDRESESLDGLRPLQQSSVLTLAEARRLDFAGADPVAGADELDVLLEIPAEIPGVLCGERIGEANGLGLGRP